jgi:hypothetical protein
MALQFVRLAILVQFVVAIVVFVLRLYKHAWSINLSAIITAGLEPRARAAVRPDAFDYPATQSANRRWLHIP